MTHMSVITPSLNDGRYIAGAIESILAQETVPFEHIVMDGGSVDESAAVVAQYSTVQWVCGEDDGMYEAINKGITIATGDIVGYLNADDRYHPHTFERVRAAFDQDAALDFVYGYCDFINEEGRRLYRVRPLPYSLAKRSLATLWPQPGWFWRKRVHDEVGLFDTRYRCVGDVDLMRRFVAEGLRGRLLRSTLATFMLRSDCLSITQHDLYERERLACRDHFGVDKRSAGKALAETIFALQNVKTYAARAVGRQQSWDA